MDIDENKLRRISKGFRRAIEETDFSEASVGTEGHARMSGFPHGACAEATTLLGIYLTKDHSVSPLVEVIAQMVKDGIWLGSHHWLEYNEIVIDITADQFEMVSDPVIVSNQSDFHLNCAEQVYKNPSAFRLEDQQEWMMRLYDAIVKCVRKFAVASGGG